MVTFVHHSHVNLNCESAMAEHPSVKSDKTKSITGDKQEELSNS